MLARNRRAKLSCSCLLTKPNRNLSPGTAWFLWSWRVPRFAPPERRGQQPCDTQVSGEAWLTGQCVQQETWYITLHAEAVLLRAGRAGVEGSAEAVDLGGLCDQSTLTQGTSVYCSVLHTCPWHDISTNSDQWGWLGDEAVELTGSSVINQN